MSVARKNCTVRRCLCFAFLLLLTALSLFPFYLLLINATRAHAQIQQGFSFLPGMHFFKNLANLLADENMLILRGLFNSVFVSVMCAALATYFSSMTAYGVYMYRFKGRNVAVKFILAVMMIPAQVSTLGFIKLLGKLCLLDTLASLYIPAIASPVVFFYIYQAMQSMLPSSIVEAARVDGSNEFMTFNRIVIPIMKPAIAVQAIFAFVSSWNNYFAPALIIDSDEKKTIPILIAQLRGADYKNFDMGQVYMMIFLAIIPLVVVYTVLSRSIVDGMTLGSIKE